MSHNSNDTPQDLPPVDPETEVEYSITLPFYTISKEFAFSASHRLLGLPAEHQCSRLHGHNYIVRVMLGARTLDQRGFIVDYGDLAFVKEFLDTQWDHRHLNDHPSFKAGHNATAEVMASMLVNLVANEMVGVVDMIEVGVSETPKTWATCQVVIGRQQAGVGDQVPEVVQCRHCGHMGEAGEDHTCTCPNSDDTCTVHPKAANDE